MYRNHIITPRIEPVVQTAYKMLRTRILQRMRANMWQTIAVTSATQGDGKSISSVNLAISLAGDVNHNVCLVDLDLRHSSIASYLGLTPKLGVSDCLERQIPVEQASDQNRYRPPGRPAERQDGDALIGVDLLAQDVRDRGHSSRATRTEL